MRIHGNSLTPKERNYAKKEKGRSTAPPCLVVSLNIRDAGNALRATLTGARGRGGVFGFWRFSPIASFANSDILSTLADVC